jgi:hypothetical protein
MRRQFVGDLGRHSGAIALRGASASCCDFAPYVDGWASSALHGVVPDTVGSERGLGASPIHSSFFRTALARGLH